LSELFFVSSFFSAPLMRSRSCVEIVSASDSYAAQRRKTKRYVEQGAVYAVVIDPRTRKVEDFGTAPNGLALDFDRIIDAGEPPAESAAG